MTNIVYTDYAPVVIVTRKTDGTIDYGDWNIQGQTQTSTYNPTTLSYTYTYTRPAPLKDAKGTEFYPQNIAYLSPKVTWDSTAGKSVYTLPAKGGLDYPISLPTGKTNIGDWCDGNSSQVQTYDPKTRTYSIDRTKCGKPEYGANGVVEPYEFITLSSSTSGGSVSAYPSGTGVYKTVAATTTTTPQINYGDFVISAYLKTSETYNAYSYPVTLKGKPTPISYRARVTDWATGLVGIDGISVTTIGLIPEISTTTDANGYFTISAIPRGVSFTIKLNKATYSDVYTARISFTGSNDSSSTPYNMILPADFATIGSTTGTGVISSSVRDSSNGNPLSGVVVTATDSANSATTYPVVYRSDTTGTWDTTLTSTSSRGQWRVLNIPAGKTVTVTAKLAVGSYYTFGTRTFDVKADSLSQTTLRGTAVTVTVLK
jgi:hypothetical protein